MTMLTILTFLITVSFRFHLSPVVFRVERTVTITHLLTTCFISTPDDLLTNNFLQKLYYYL